MFVRSEIPDPYPGRCHCTKFNPHPGVMQYERCLGYDTEAHICTFEERRPQTTWASSMRKQIKDPDPWVSPLEKDTHENS